ncbi:MAG TPA: hypothetical protein VFE22_04520 [Edaphobacter sp.]|jgi:hypothetical protein|nr:hypothetical protein [Edaphobacter sp.]
MRSPGIFALMVCLLTFTGCHSHRVQTTVSNRTGQPILLLEVDYPSASFGTQNLAAGADFHYRFKVLGTGRVNLTYTDGDHHDHKSEGPYLNEKADGPLQIVIAPDGVHWQTSPGTTIQAPPAS